MNAPAKFNPALIGLAGVMAPPSGPVVSVDEFEELQAQLAKLTKRVKKLEKNAASDTATIVAFSGDMDRVMASFIIATGAAAMGMEVTMFFTFWGLTALKKKTTFRKKRLTQKMMGLMLPGGPASLGTSRMNMMGMGPAFFKHVMKQHKVQTVPQLIEVAQELGVKMKACQMSMDLMGITREELIDGIDYCGVGGYLGDALDAKMSLFV